MGSLARPLRVVQAAAHTRAARARGEEGEDTFTAVCRFRPVIRLHTTHTAEASAEPNAALTGK